MQEAETAHSRYPLGEDRTGDNTDTQCQDENAKRDELREMFFLLSVAGCSGRRSGVEEAPHALTPASTRTALSFHASK